MKLLNDKAADLEKAARELTQTANAGKVKTFLDELIRGDSRIENFEKLQDDLSMAQTTLITALVASNNTNSAYSYINVEVVTEVDNCFSCLPEVNSEANYPKRILHLIKERGTPLGDGTICSVSTEDLEMLAQNLPWSQGKTVRIISDNKMKDFGLVTADVGKKGEGRPHVDTVIARNNEVFGNAYMIVGTIDYKSSMQMMTVRAGLDTLKGDKQVALNNLNQLVPGLAGPSPGSESIQRTTQVSESHQVRRVKVHRVVHGSG